jgi:hypothetical protein
MSPQTNPRISWQREVPDAMRSLDTLASPDYTDLFTGITAEARTKSAEQWARTLLEDAPLGLRMLIPAVHRVVLGLRIQLRGGPGYVLGWKIADRSDDFLRLETTGWLMTPHLVLKVDEDRVSVATFVRYEHPAAARIWRPVSRLHRRVGLALLRHALGTTSENLARRP